MRAFFRPYWTLKDWRTAASESFKTVKQQYRQSLNNFTPNY